jgi:hypothetical protein
MLRKLIGGGCAAAAFVTVVGFTPPAAAAQPVAGAAAANCPVSVLFCEDFDGLPTGDAGAAAWAVDARNGTLKVEAKPVQSGDAGNHVLHVHTLDNGYAFLRVNNFAAPGNRFYGRMRLLVDAFPTAPAWAHFTLVEATGTGSSEIVRPVGGQYVPTVGKSLWGVGADGGPTGDWTNWRESAPVTEDAWTCVEWQLDATGNQVAAWFDGTPNPDLTASTNVHGGNGVPFILPTVNTVRIGWQLYQGGTTPGQFDLWIDDVALSSQRLGC